MKKPYPVFCKDCVHSKPDERSDWNIRCHSPIVNANDAWALSGDKMSGSDCHREREKTSWFAKCGMRGKLWEGKK